MPTAEFEALVAIEAEHITALALSVQSDIHVGLADQYGAASRDTHSSMERVADRLDTHVRREEVPGSPEAWESNVRVLARATTVMRLRNGPTLCPHLDPNAPLPSMVMLAFGVNYCRWCVSEYDPPVLPDDEDRCDWCGDHGVHEFTPVFVQVGPMMLVGDACDGCVEVMQ